MYDTAQKERALLVVVREPSETWSKEDLASEFRNLVISTGIKVVDLLFINLRLPNPRTYIGKGKVEELKAAVEEHKLNVVIFNANLNFNQQRNLEDVLTVKTIDRTQLILDIFCQHAHTQEGILQVELAQLEYLMPRLKGKGVLLSRLGGGIGTRGPGETKLEIDRRRITDRISRLKNELERVREHRKVIRKKRQKENLALCSLVGYTNAGKTTLFNALTGSSQTSTATMFTTLDTVTRGLTLENNSQVILSDTVGFIYKVPAHLIAAFKATLEELQYADILLHVIDASNKNVLAIKKSVETTLNELHLTEKTTLAVFNKLDALDEAELTHLQREFPQAIFVSAVNGTGLKALPTAISQSLVKNMIEVIVKVPLNRMELGSYLHQHYQILKTNYTADEAVYWMRIELDQLPQLKKRGLSIKEI